MVVKPREGRAPVVGILQDDVLDLEEGGGMMI